MPLSDLTPNFWGDNCVSDEDDNEYDNRCSIISKKEYFDAILKRNGVDIDNLKPEILHKQDSIELTFQLEFPFMFSASDRPEMLIYLHDFLGEQKVRTLRYAALLPKNHRVTFRIPRILHYPKRCNWEFWLIERSQLKCSAWVQDESLHFENYRFPHEYSVKLLEWAYWRGPRLKTTIFTPM